MKNIGIATKEEIRTKNKKAKAASRKRENEKATRKSMIANLRKHENQKGE